MRGKAGEFGLDDNNKRITPAYAGKRWSADRKVSAGRDHPRLCGEKLAACKYSVSRSGSPPPMRGKGHSPSRRMSKDGITPAYAGKRHAGMVYNRYRGDHPRLCGEKSLSGLLCCMFNGSPPPMRGKVAVSGVDFYDAGITPAYAGKRPTFDTIDKLAEDHPRLCGEKVAASQKQACESGSPPPMRGKVHDLRTAHRTSRITPAYAGKRGQHGR